MTRKGSAADEGPEKVTHLSRVTTYLDSGTVFKPACGAPRKSLNEGHFFVDSSQSHRVTCVSCKTAQITDPKETRVVDKRGPRRSGSALGPGSPVRQFDDALAAASKGEVSKGAKGVVADPGHASEPSKPPAKRSPKQVDLAGKPLKMAKVESVMRTSMVLKADQYGLRIGEGTWAKLKEETDAAERAAKARRIVTRTMKPLDPDAQADVLAGAVEQDHQRLTRTLLHGG